MAKWGRRSSALLATCHEDLRSVMDATIADLDSDDEVVSDMRVISGYRTEEEQAAKVREGNSKTMHSKHRETPSEAIDVAPYPTDWADEDAFVYLAGRIMATAHRLGIKLLWGGVWQRRNPKALRDLGHFELIERT